jgi:hypothetical protein
LLRKEKDQAFVQSRPFPIAAKQDILYCYGGREEEGKEPNVSLGLDVPYPVAIHAIQNAEKEVFVQDIFAVP